MKQYLFAILVAMMLVACQQPDGPLATQIADSNGTLNAAATGTAVVPAQATDTPIVTATYGIVTVTPHPTVESTGVPHITEVSEEDVAILSRLCATEVRAMVTMRETACLSIIATVDKRIRLGKYSDSTIRGTVGWGCTAESLQCQYPASVIFGCEGFKSGTCWWDFEADVRWFEPTVWRYFFGERGRCDGFLNYGSRESDMGDCIIQDGNQREGFFNEGE